MMTLEEMRDIIPEMKCLDNCSDCCGPVYGTKEEMDRLPDKGKALLYAWVHNECCPYLKDNRCIVYDERPMVCRLFGTVKDSRLKCPHGVQADYPLQGMLYHKLRVEYKEMMVKSSE